MVSDVEPDRRATRRRVAADRVVVDPEDRNDFVVEIGLEAPPPLVNRERQAGERFADGDRFRLRRVTKLGPRGHHARCEHQGTPNHAGTVAVAGATSSGAGTKRRSTATTRNNIANANTNTSHPENV